MASQKTVKLVRRRGQFRRDDVWIEDREDIRIYDAVWVCHSGLRELFSMSPHVDTLWLSISRLYQQGWDHAVRINNGCATITLHNGELRTKSLPANVDKVLRKLKIRPGRKFWFKLEYT